MIYLHICQDGTITYRAPGEPVFNGVALPFMEVKSVMEAKALMIALCARQYTEHPKNPGQPWYVFPGFAGELEDIPRVTKLFEETLVRLKGHG